MDRLPARDDPDRRACRDRTCTTTQHHGFLSVRGLSDGNSVRGPGKDLGASFQSWVSSPAIPSRSRISVTEAIRRRGLDSRGPSMSLRRMGESRQRANAVRLCGFRKGLEHPAAAWASSGPLPSPGLGINKKYGYVIITANQRHAVPGHEASGADI